MDVDMKAAQYPGMVVGVAVDITVDMHADMDVDMGAHKFCSLL